MFVDILPDLLRGTTTTICLLILLPILSKTKLKYTLRLLIDLVLVVIDFLVCTHFYLIHDYTGVVYYSLAFYLVIIVLFKFLLKEKTLQWLFNCVTVLNVYVIIVISSYYLSGLFPDPEYAVTILRIVSFVLVIVFFKVFLRPLYLEVSENWGAFLLPTTGIFANYLYIMLSLGEVESSMHENIVLFYFLTVITIFTYTAIIISLKSLRVKFLLREENIKRKANEVLLKSEIVSYESAVNSAKQTRHDIRHHNSILAEYLQTGDIDGAKNYLKLYDDRIIENSSKDFSKNPIANAVFRIYDRQARENNIEFVVQSEADVLLEQRLPDIGIVLSNILENALSACKQCPFNDKHVYYRSYEKNDCVLVEIKNSVAVKLKFENGLPVTTKSGGGTGLLSIKSAVEKYQGLLDVRQNGNEFSTLIILPLA